MKRAIAVAALAGSLLSCAGAQVPEAPPPPADILHQAAATYRSLETYAAEGTATMELDFGGQKTNVETAFSMHLVH